MLPSIVVPVPIRQSIRFCGLLPALLPKRVGLGRPLAPPLIGYLSDRTGSLRTAMLLLPAVGLLGGLVILIALKTVAGDIGWVGVSNGRTVGP